MPAARLMTRLLFYGLLTLQAAAALAQTATLTGTVQDDQGAALPGVNITLDRTTRGTATDAAGSYTLPSIPPGTYTVVASAVGFQTARERIFLAGGETVQLDFVLSEAVLQGDAVVVTASRREQEASTVPVSVSVLSPRDIETRNLLSIDEALRNIPGVQLTGSTVNVRGSSGFAYSVGSRVLLLIDGNPMLGPDQGNVPFSLLPMSQIERIEVVKGPGSALYGSGALGGVINILTKDFPEQPETTVNLFAGGYEPVLYETWRASWDEAETVRVFGGATATHARRVNERFGFWTTVQYLNDPGYRRGSSSTALKAHGKFGWHLGPGLDVDLFGGITQRTREAFLFWQSAREPLIAADSDFLTGGTGTSRVQEISALPVLTHVLNPSLFYVVRGRFFATRVLPLDEQGEARSREKRTFANRYGVEWQINWSPAADRFVTAGLTGDWNDADSQFYIGTDADPVRAQPEGAAFAQIEQRLWDRLILVAGARFDAYRLDAAETLTRLSPKLNASYQFHPALTVRASFGQGFRVPSVAERYINNRDFLPVIPNLDLRPEESTGYEVGLKAQLSLGRGWGVQADVAGFWNEYENLVEPKFRAGENAFQFINLTEARIRGVESMLRLGTLDDRASVQIAYLYLKPEDLTGPIPQPLAFRSDHLFHATGTARLVGPLDAGIDFRVASRPERLDSDFARFVPDSDVMVPVRVLDLRLGASFGPYLASILIKNALDYYYVERPALLAPPRSGTLQLQARF